MNCSPLPCTGVCNLNQRNNDRPYTLILITLGQCTGDNVLGRIKRVFTPTRKRAWVEEVSNAPRFKDFQPAFNRTKNKTPSGSLTVVGMMSCLDPLDVILRTSESTSTMRGKKLRTKATSCKRNGSLQALINLPDPRLSPSRRSKIPPSSRLLERFSI